MPDDQGPTLGNRKWDDLIFVVAKIGALGIILAGGAWLIYLIAKRTNESTGAVQFEIVLPIIVVWGVVSLLLTLGVIVSILTQHGIVKPPTEENNSDAFGLPRGSIQAAIALILLLVFIITALFVASAGTSESIKTALEEQPTVAAAPTEPPPSPTVSVVDDTATALGQDTPTPTQSPTGAVRGTASLPTTLVVAGSSSESSPSLPTASPSPQPTATPVPQPTPVIAGNRKPIDKDIAIQLITIVGTLATAVTSFYFASNSGGGHSTLPAPGASGSGLQGSPSGTRDGDGGSGKSPTEPGAASGLLERDVSKPPQGAELAPDDALRNAQVDVDETSRILDKARRDHERAQKNQAHLKELAESQKHDANPPGDK